MFEKNKELLKYTVYYDEGCPGIRRYRSGYFRITEDEIQFLFIGPLSTRSEDLRFPTGSITSIQISEKYLVGWSSWLRKILIPLMVIVLRKPVMKRMIISFADNDGNGQAVMFEDILSEHFVNGIQRAFDILVAERKRHQSLTGK